MNTEEGVTSNPVSTKAGGSLEPANRATVAKERFQTPAAAPGWRFEMRDPFAEVTYRTETQAEMVAKAERIGSLRFTAIDADGNRTLVYKVNGSWQRSPDVGPHLKPVGVDRVRVDSGPAEQGSDRSSLSRGREAAAVRSVSEIDAKAEREAHVARLEALLLERYLIKRSPVVIGETTIGRTEYRFRGDSTRLAFTESTFRLSTDINNPSVARSMIDVAEARNWRGLRVSGNEEFKRIVWLEASARGLKTIGYEPSPSDLALLRTAQEERQTNRIEPARNGPSPEVADTAATRGNGRKAVLAAIEAVLVAKGVSDPRREAVLAAAAEKLAQRVRDGQSIKVKVYDKTAPSQRSAPTPVADRQKDHERGARSR